MSHRPHYGRVWLTFLRNALVREMAFRGHFAITLLTRAFWFAAQIVLFRLIYANVRTIADWTESEYLAFMATGMLVNGLVETFFMPNCANFGELIRTGNLDFALLKPIDTQFLVSFEKMDLANLSHLVLAGGLLVWALVRIGEPVSLAAAATYLLLVVLGTVFFYSLMIALASTSVWFGRHQGLYEFWFYVTIFARYPQGIYTGSPAAEIVRFAFSYVVPILLVVTVPARTLLSKALEPSWLTWVAVGSTLAGLVASRLVFRWSLTKYRSASS